MNPTEKLQELFLKFPGIGPKQAARFVYFLLRQKEVYKIELAKNIEMLKDSSHICESCLRVFSKLKNQENKLCSICEDDTRDSKSLMIVVKELDIDAIEKTGFYHGKYFVLGSVLPFLTEKPTDILNIRELVNLIHSNLQNGDKNICESNSCYGAEYWRYACTVPNFYADPEHFDPEHFDRCLDKTGDTYADKDTALFPSGYLRYDYSTS